MAARHFKEKPFLRISPISVCGGARLRRHPRRKFRRRDFPLCLPASLAGCLSRSRTRPMRPSKSFLRHPPPAPPASLPPTIFLPPHLRNRHRSWVLRCPKTSPSSAWTRSKWSRFSSPVDLSSVDIDSFKIGYTAAEVLCKLIEDPAMTPPQIRIPPKGILVAASTDHLATTDPMVASAVSHIRQYACGGSPSMKWPPPSAWAGACSNAASAKPSAKASMR